jgi:hypothetical protein
MLEVLDDSTRMLAPMTTTKLVGVDTCFPGYNRGWILHVQDQRLLPESSQAAIATSGWGPSWS